MSVTTTRCLQGLAAIRGAECSSGRRNVRLCSRPAILGRKSHSGAKAQLQLPLQRPSKHQSSRRTSLKVSATAEPELEMPSAREWSAMREELCNDTLAVVIRGLSEKLGREVEFVRVAGRGAFADVALARAVESGVEMAVKISAGTGNMNLLQRESRALTYLNTLDDAQHHVIQMLLPYLEVDVAFQDGSSHPVGLFVLESGLCDVDEFVRENVESDVSVVATVLDQWEQSTKWLHSNSVLHLDIKAENAVVCEDGSVKLIDTTGIITRYHSTMDDDDSVPADKVSWDTGLLSAQDIPYISTETYAQPEEAGPGGRVLDYSADWWSMGISKLEMLGVQPGLFEDDADTAAMVMEGLESGELEAAARRRLAELLGAEEGSEGVSLWVGSVMANLRGTASEGPLDGLSDEAPM